MSEIEPFVNADAAAQFLCVTRRRVLELARACDIPAHPIRRGKRKTWRFRLSELAEAIGKRQAENVSGIRGMMRRAVP